MVLVRALCQPSDSLYVNSISQKSFTVKFEFSGVPTEPTPFTASANRSSARFFYCVSARYKRDFVDLQEKFGDMFDEVQEDVKLHVQIDDLKQYLCDKFRELETDVQNAGTTNDVMKVVRNECTLAEYSYFEKIANCFDLQEAKASIRYYCNALDDFCTHTLETHSYARSFCVDHPEPILPSSNKIEVTFKLEWNAKEKSLKDVRDVLRMVFGDLTDRVNIMVIKDSCVVVVCWAPQYLMMALVRLANSKLDQLKEIGVVELTVGYIELITKKVDAVGRSQTALDDLPFQGKKLTISDREDTCSRDSLSGRQNVELVIASLPSLSDQLNEFTKELIEQVDETVHKIVRLKAMGIKVSSEGKTVCRELLVVTDSSFNYIQAINDFTWNARDKRQQLAFKEAAKEESPNFNPMNEYIQHIKQYLGRAGEKYEIFRESCKSVVERLGEVAEKTQKQANEEGSKKTTSQVTGGLVTGGAMATAIGAGVGTGIGLTLAAGIPTLGIGTIIGLGVAGIGTTTAAALGTQYVAEHYSKKKMALQNLIACIMNLERQASQLNHVLDQINMTMNTFDELIQDVEVYMTTPHQRESLLNSMRLLFTRIEEFHSVSSKCYETLQKSQKPLKQLTNKLDDDSV